MFFDVRITKKDVKKLDGYSVYFKLRKITHNLYGLRSLNFYNRLLHKCGSIKRIYDFAFIKEYNLFEVFYYSRRGYLYSTYIDKRGY